VSRRASSYQKKQVEWFWPARFAIGMLGLVDGDPSRGKSQMLALFAGHVTKGRPWPDGSPCPLGGMVIVGAEDPIEEVWVPRLEAVGADLELVVILQTKDDGSPIRLPEDIPFLEREIQAVGARAIAFDPIMSYLTGLTNPNSDKDVRQALSPLNEMLVRNRCAGIMLRHFNKDNKTSQALYRGMASIAFGALARTGFAVAKDPDAAGGFVFAPTKNNLAPYPASLKYRIVEVDLGDGFKTSRIEWQGESQRSAEELVTAFGAEASKAQTAEQMLREWLADGPTLSDDLWARAQAASITFATYRRVKEVTLRCRAGQHKGRWYSWLPEHDRLWELVREQKAITSDWTEDSNSDAHDSSSDAHKKDASPGSGEPDAHLPSRTRAHAREDSPFEHLILSNEHLPTPDAQMLIGEETGLDGYGEALMAEPDPESEEEGADA
jgi:putative DNA primase/helicase